MKIKRYKKVNRHIKFYANNFGFRPPYQLLVDGTFCHAALKVRNVKNSPKFIYRIFFILILKNQVNIADNIPKYLQAEIKLLTTQCAVIEAESLGYKVFGALQILKQYAIHKCGHEGKPKPGASCFLSMCNKNNEKHYIVATQDRDLQKKLRAIPGVPILYLYQKAPVLEKPSDETVEVAQKKFSTLNEWEKSQVERLRQENGLVQEKSVKKPKKLKKKEPNPLSCKKKKKTSQSVQGACEKTQSVGVVSNAIKKRKKVRIPKHVKEELLKLNKTSM